MAERLTSPLSGYSTQAQLSLRVADLINNGRIRFWFATSINPPDNELSSNPLEIFAQLERVARRGKRAEDYEKISSLTARLRSWILIGFDEGAEAAAEALGVVDMACAGEVKLFQPVMMELRDVFPSWHVVDDEYIVENEPIKNHQMKPSFELVRPEIKTQG
ncbi:MAG: hypothetical protein GC160_26560 [Acidobacteria bacterium]|nr:hypothetical protein [Acidobacteriota bacterium]